MTQTIKNIIEWVKNNKLTALLVLVVAYFLIPRLGLFNTIGYKSSTGLDTYNMGYAPGLGAPSRSIGVSDVAENFAPDFIVPPINTAPPQPDVSPRRVITNSSMSLLVKDVRETANRITQKAEELQGYMVSRNVNTPIEGGTGYVVIRVPLDRREEMVNFLQSVGVRVLNEYVDAQDVTDQYEDLDAQLAQLERTKTRFEEIYEQATTVDEILRVQNQIQNIQRQIDTVKGRMQALDAQSRTTLISVNLTTDELALPYSPGAPWRPEVTFKLAVRSLMLALRTAGNAVIWVAVYSVIWVPALLAVYIVRNYVRKRSS